VQSDLRFLEFLTIPILGYLICSIFPPIFLESSHTFVCDDLLCRSPELCGRITQIGSKQDLFRNSVIFCKPFVTSLLQISKPKVECGKEPGLKKINCPIISLQLTVP
jgi:hypothetical protein